MHSDHQLQPDTEVNTMRRMPPLPKQNAKEKRRQDQKRRADRRVIKCLERSGWPCKDSDACSHEDLCKRLIHLGVVKPEVKE